ncbi:hypothetical protein ACR3K2_08990 [Cryptosporidium serpentis]
MDHSFCRFKDLDEIASWIRPRVNKTGKTVVALQFAPNDVKFAPTIEYQIKKRLFGHCRGFDPSQSFSGGIQLEIVVLSDLLSPPCCIDVLGVKKCSANILVHFGHSCFQNINQFDIPIMLVFPNETNNLCCAMVLGKLGDLIGSQLNKVNCDVIHNIIISYDLGLHHIFFPDDIQELPEAFAFLEEFLKLQLSSTNISLYLLAAPKTLSCGTNISHMNIFGRKIRSTSFSEESIDKIYDLLQSGNTKEQLNSKIYLFHLYLKNTPNRNGFLERFLVTYGSCCSIYPCTLSNDSITIDKPRGDELGKLILKRFNMIESAKLMSNRVGLIITPNMSSNTWKMLKKYKSIRTRKDKYYINTDTIEYFIIAMSGINEVKLGNFPRIQVFCYIGCLEYFFFCILKEHNIRHPIILTCFEYEIYLGIREWSTAYLDIDEMIRNEHYTQFPDTLGKFTTEIVDKPNGSFASSNILEKMDLATKLLHSTLVSKRLENGSFYGLDPSDGIDVIPRILVGHSGIASMYAQELNSL